MLLDLTPREISDRWKTLSDLSLEAGQRPELYVVNSNSELVGLGALHAFEIFSARRHVGAPPLVLAGGASSVWLLTHLHPVSDTKHEVDGSSASDVTAYLGADPATSISSANSYELVPVRNGSHRFVPAPGDLETGYLPHFLPRAQPGQPVRWSALPFAVKHEQRTDAEIGLGTDFPEVLEPNWTSAAAIFVAICLVLLALVL